MTSGSSLPKMKQVDLNEFKTNVDAWVKQIRHEFSEFQKYPTLIEENIGNTQHNYELIQELKDEVESLKHELQTLRLIQLATLKAQMPVNQLAKTSQ